MRRKMPPGLSPDGSSLAEPTAPGLSGHGAGRAKPPLSSATYGSFRRSLEAGWLGGGALRPLRFAAVQRHPGSWLRSGLTLFFECIPTLGAAVRSLLSVLVLLTAACRKPASEPDAPPRKVHCVESTTRQHASTVTLRGTITPLPDRDAQLAPQVSGRLASLEVREGDLVTKNQVVARVEMATLIDAMSQAQAALSRAQAERQNAQTTRARSEKVFEKGIAARQDVDDALSREAAAKATEADAAAAANQAHRQVDRTLLRSPLNGVVLRVLRRPGELVDGTPATPVVEVADLSRLELAVDAPVQDLMRVTPGDAASITFPALPNLSIAAKVVVVAPSVDRASGLGVIRLELTLGPGKAPPVGTYGLAHVDVGEAAGATWVRVPAVRNVLGDEGEVVACGATARVVRVVPAIRDGEWVQVTGLDAGVPVVVEGLLGLNDGDALELEK